MPSKLKYPLIYIEWCDAMTNDESWLDVENVIGWADNEDWSIIQTGFLIKETKEYILFAARVNKYLNTNKIDRVDGIIKIPTTWIRKKIDLTKFISS